MKNLVMSIICALVCAHAIEYSHRIKALGTDFAYLIPDYETDLYRDTELFGKRMVGVAYDGNSRPANPAKGLVLTNRFGWYGRYWLRCGFSHATFDDYWSTSRLQEFYFEDLWMVDMRGHVPKFLEGVWHLYNDGYYINNTYENSSGYNERMTHLACFLKTQGTHKISDALKMSNLLGVGVYWQRYQTDGTDHMNEMLLMPSGRFGLFYRNAENQQKFTSWFIDIGGPVSTGEIDALPYSLFSDRLWAQVTGTMGRTVWFASTFIAKIAWVKGIPIRDNGFIAFGCRNDFLHQRVAKPDTNLIQRGINNAITVPLAVEYWIHRVAVRFGTKCYYRYTRDQEYDDDLIDRHTSFHRMDYDYSFGLGWVPVDRFHIDLNYYQQDEFDLKDWEIYLKYLL